MHVEMSKADLTKWCNTLGETIENDGKALNKFALAKKIHDSLGYVKEAAPVAKPDKVEHTEAEKAEFAEKMQAKYAKQLEDVLSRHRAYSIEYKV